MRHFAAFLVLLAFLAAAAGADPLGGSQGCDAAYSIRFDNLNAPADFDRTGPLTTEYLGQGIEFFGPGPGQGGALLNERSGYGVVGHSPPNFIAFDATTYAVGPETLEFFGPVNTVLLQAGIRGNIGDAGRLTLECFGPDGEPRGSATIAGSATLQQLYVAAPGIVSCAFHFTSRTAVIDDLVYVPCNPVLGGGGYDIAIPTLDLPRLALFAALILGAALLHLARRA